jgi:hypothetical protein
MSGKSLLLGLVLVLAAGPAMAAPFAPDGDIDLGRPGDDPVAAGSYTEAAGVYSVLGGGSDWWTNPGEMAHFVYEEIAGDFRIEADVTWINRTGDWNAMDNWVKAGLALRNDVDNGAGNEKEVNYFMTHLKPPRKEVAHQGRPTETGGMFNTQVSGLVEQDNRRLALNRTTVGGIPYVEGFYHDGTNWVKVRGDYAMNLGGTAYAGLAVTAHNNDGRLETAEFRDVVVLGATAAIDPGRSPGTPVNDPEGVAPIAGGWGVLEVAENGNLGKNLNDFITSLESGTGVRVAYNQMGPINYNNAASGNPWSFPNDREFELVVQGLAGPNLDDTAFLAKGVVDIPVGDDWTFACAGDDVTELTVTQGGVKKLVIGDSTWNTNKFGTCNLAAGPAEIQFMFGEDGGGMFCEVSAARGTTTNIADCTLIGYAGGPDLRKNAPIVLENSPGWDVVCIYDPPSANLTDAAATIQAYWAGTLTPTTFGTEQATTLNYHDPDGGGGGHGYPQVAFPGGTPGTGENQFALGAQAQIEVEAGEGGLYTFMTLGDDGSIVQIPGTSGWTVAGDAVVVIPGTEDGFMLTGCCHDAFGTVNLAEGTTYDINVIFNEIGGGAYFGLWAAMGEYTAYDPAAFQLLGENIDILIPDPAGLQLIPEPATLALLGIGLVALIRRKR